ISTAEIAMSYKVPTFAVPNSIYNQESIGCNNLISKGASLFCIDSIAPITKDNQENSKLPNEELDDIEKIILNSLNSSSKTLDELLLFVNIPISELLEKVSIMELEDKILVSPSQILSVK
ncbi:MAG: hypothetical protein RR838_11350, partial [Clostridium sp.]